MSAIIKVENLSKEYRLGVIGHGTLYRDLQTWWAKVRGKEDPNSKLMEKKRLQGDRFWALKDISFEIQPGDRVGIIGRNGAGKSTLLKILSRVTTPTSGNVKIRGRVASLLEVGTGFHPELTGRENIFLNGAILGMTKAEVKKKFDEIVDFAGVEDFIDTPVKRYSSGMYVRLAFAVAAHLDPEILIVDEVLAVGDAEFQKKCLGKMQDVSKNQGRTVIFVSHNMGAIRSLCNKGILLNDGAIRSNGDVEECLTSYLNVDEKNALVNYKLDPSKQIQILEVRVKNNYNSLTSYLDILHPFTVEVDYQVHESVSGVVIGMTLSTPLNDNLLATCDFDMDRTKLGARKRGLHQTWVTFPSHLFNSGILNLSVGISIPGKVIYDRKEVMQIEFFDSGSFVVNGGGETRRNSILLIPLKWNVDRN